MSSSIDHKNFVPFEERKTFPHSKGKYWCFTIWPGSSPLKPIKDILATPKGKSDWDKLVQFIVYQTEIDGLEYRAHGMAGKTHVQGYIELKNPTSLRGVKDILVGLPPADGPHLTLANGTAEDNINYCSKEREVYVFPEHMTDADVAAITDWSAWHGKLGKEIVKTSELRPDDIIASVGIPGTQFRHGEPTNFKKRGAQGKRTDVDELYEICRTGATVFQVAETLGAAVASKHMRLIDRFNVRYAKPRMHHTQLFVHHGPTKRGKSTKVKELYAKEIAEGKVFYYSPLNQTGGSNWWDGYDAHEIVIMDDIDENTFAEHTWKQLINHTPYRVQTKGSSVEFVAKVIVLICNDEPTNPRKWFPSADNWWRHRWSGEDIYGGPGFVPKSFVKPTLHGIEAPPEEPTPVESMKDP